jgi:hypothetical protein
MPKELSSFLQVILAISHCNAECCELGTLRSLTVKAPTKFLDKYEGNSAEQTTGETHLPNAGTTPWETALH